MPKKMEVELKRRGKKMGLSKERLDKYVYGTMRKTGWKPSREMGRGRKSSVMHPGA